MDAKQQRATPAPAALDNDDLLRLISAFLDDPADLVRSALVSTRWLAAASDPAFLRDFAVRCPPRLLGFLAVVGPDPLGDEHSSDDDNDDASDEDEEIGGGDGESDEEDAIGCGDDVRDEDASSNGEELSSDGERDEEVEIDDGGVEDFSNRFVPLPDLPTKLAGAGRLVAAAFNVDGGDLAKACRNGHVLVVPGARVDGTYSVRRPLRLTANGVSDVVHLPALPLDEKVDNNVDEERFVARFVLVRGNQPGGGDDLSSCHDACMLTAVQDTEGVIHAKFIVQVLQEGAWVTHTSSDLQVQKPVDTYVSPYGLVVGNRLYMLIITGYIAVFDVAASSFSLHKLPDGVSCGDGGVLDHRLARAGDTGLYLVHLRGTELRFLRHLHGMDDASGVWEWELVNTVVFQPRGAFFSDLGFEIYAVVGDDAAFVFLMVRGDIGLFLFDVKSLKLKKVLQTSPTNDGHLYRVLPFMMPWPPIFLAQEEGNVN